MRTFDIMHFTKESFDVRLAEPFDGTGRDDFTVRMDAMQKWTDAHTEGEYLILLKSVAFRREADALIFKLKYGY